MTNKNREYPVLQLGNLIPGNKALIPKSKRYRAQAHTLYPRKENNSNTATKRNCRKDSHKTNARRIIT